MSRHDASYPPSSDGLFPTFIARNEILGSVAEDREVHTTTTTTNAAAAFHGTTATATTNSSSRRKMDKKKSSSNSDDIGHDELRKAKKKSKKKKSKKASATTTITPPPTTATIPKGNSSNDNAKDRSSSMGSHSQGGSNGTRTTHPGSSSGEPELDVWPQEQQLEWQKTIHNRQESEKWSDLASMGGFSEIGGLHVASAAQSVAGESLDPQMVFKKIDRRERKQRSGGTSMHGSVGSKSSSTLITANLGTSRFADDESFNPESVFERIDRAHRSSSTLDNTSKPARRRSSSSSISDSRARASALKDPPPMAGADLLLAAPSEPLSFPESAGAAANSRRKTVASYQQISSMKADEFDNIGVARMPTSTAESKLRESNGQAGDLQRPLIQYLLSMGYDHAKAANVASGFVAEQQAREQAPLTKSPMTKQSIRNSHQAVRPPVNREGSSQPSSSRINYHRFQTPGAVEMEGRAFGAPLRPPPAPVRPPSDEAMIEMEALEAIPVDDECSQAPVIYADSSPLSLKYALKNKSLRRALLLGIAILIVAVTTTTVMLLKGGSKTASSNEPLEPTMAPSSAPTFINNDVLNAAAQISGWDSLNEVDSPQFKAVGWMSAVDESDFDNFGSSFAQRYAMVVFFHSTNGDEWTNRESWLDPTLHVCDWGEGITCSTDSTYHQFVTGIDTTRNGLSGTIPVEIGLLQAAENLRFAKNNIGGSIPDAITNLNRLTSLDLSTNILTGQIPSNVGNISDLVVLNLSNNKINGSVPESLYTLSVLQTLDLSWNEMTGLLIDDVAQLQALATFDVRHNRLTGTVTGAFDKLIALDFLWLDYNEFTGNLPAVSSVMANRLEITFSHNKFQGPLPPFGRRRSLQESTPELSLRIQKVDVSYNQLTGTISPVAAFVPSLRWLDFSGNGFSGQFPGDSGWSGLEYLVMSNNLFTGTLPVGFSLSLNHLDFSNNSLTKGIPEGLCGFPGLTFLGLADNNYLNGTIPTCLTQLTDLESLHLAGSNLEGTISSSIGRLTKLEVLDLSGNRLTGSIPSELGQCSSLTSFDLSSNRFVGTIPSHLGNLSFLKSLSIGENALTGTVPPEFGELEKLENINLAGNDLEGSVPDGICSSEKNLTTVEFGCRLNCSCCDTASSVVC